MNILLIFFAIPLAVIILSAILETLIHCPFKVAGIFFSIFIVVAFALGGSSMLIVAAIIYTIISFITAAIVRLVINRMCNRCDEEENRCRFCNDECSSCNSDNTFVVNNEISNALRTINNSLNELTNVSRLNSESLNNINMLNNLNNGNFNNNSINQLPRGTQNVFSSNNSCRRSR